MKKLKTKIREAIKKLFKWIDPLPFNYFDYYKDVKTDLKYYKSARKLYHLTSEALKTYPYKITMSDYKVYIYVWEDTLKKANKTAVQAMNEIDKSLKDAGFEIYEKWTFSYGSLRSEFKYNKSTFSAGISISMDDNCEVETITVEEEKTVVTGLCAKVMEEINR